MNSIGSIQGVHYGALPKLEIPCACCGGRIFRIATRGDRYGFGLTTVVCKQCGLIFTNPRPSDEWFKEFYRDHYRKYYEDVAEPDDAYLSREWIQGRHRRNVKFLQTLVPRTGALLDVGCAEGTFLHLFQEAFPQWQIQGIEPSSSFSQFARQHYGLSTVRTTTFEELDALPDHSFGLITVNHVLEHLLDPNFLFSRVRRLLAPDGLLFIDVPDSEGTAAGLWRLHIGHVYHFTEPTLRNFLAKHGFDHVATARGDENPRPWTLQVLARVGPRLPSNWQAAAVDDGAIARNFARLCHRTFYKRMRRRLSRMKSLILSGTGKSTS